MADYKVTDTELTAVADAIRTKGGTEAQIEWSSGFVSAIGDIETGITPTGNINITDMQSTNVAAYATAQVVDANLIAENIKKDVVILGVTGTYEGSSAPEIVSWSSGTDEEVAAMIAYAHENSDWSLQTDGGWAVGDVRTINVGAFTAGGNVSVPQQNIDIVITSFNEYMSCGNVVQFDFKDELSVGVRMNPTNTNAGGYSSSEMYTDTLPALVNALPTWIKNLLIEFSVLVSVGNSSSTIETVANNKLALRSEIEVHGSNGYSAPGEGTQITYYNTTAKRTKKRGHDGSAGAWWDRSPRYGNTTGFCRTYSSGNQSDASATDSGGVAPFGCL